MEKITLYNLSESIPFCEAMGLSKVFRAYAEQADRESILDGGIGFNANYGNIYLALENGISMVSCLGQDVEYLIYNKNEEEEFFPSYKEAIEALTQN